MVEVVRRWVRDLRIPIVGDLVRSLWGTMQIAREFAEDARGYVRSSGFRPLHRRDPEQFQRDITFSYHQIEKALTFPQPRRPFGARAQADLIAQLSSINPGDIESSVLRSAREANRALNAWNAHGRVDDSVAPIRAAALGPQFDANEFFGSRHSCRNFDGQRRVAHELVVDAARAAQSAPSVCNRQAGRIHYMATTERVQAALALQNGNRGFGHSVAQLAVITVDRRAFKNSLERNQRWIDGGLFAMTFVWALHAMGVATCMLNWSMGVRATRALRDALGLSLHEDVICMVAFGHPAEGSRFARSARHNTDYVFIEHH